MILDHSVIEGYFLDSSLTESPSLHNSYIRASVISGHPEIEGSEISESVIKDSATIRNSLIGPDWHISGSPTLDAIRPWTWWMSMPNVNVSGSTYIKNVFYFAIPAGTSLSSYSNGYCGWIVVVDGQSAFYPYGDGSIRPPHAHYGCVHSLTK